VLLALVVPMTKPIPTRAKIAITMRMDRVKRTDSTATPFEAEVLNRLSHKVPVEVLSRIPHKIVRWPWTISGHRCGL
jgi:hypothetical protein